MPPPLAPLAFRVGIVGHRPDRLRDADRDVLRDVLRRILSAVREEVERFPRARPGLYAEERPRLRAVSPLAEGTDRLFAEEALGLGYELCCPMPFPRASYECDFVSGAALEPESLERFRSLLAAAADGPGLVTFELDGDRGERAAAYGAAGRVVLNQSDLVVVVWDGERRTERGGTDEILEAARGRGVPIALVSARAPHGWTIVNGHATTQGGSTPIAEAVGAADEDTAQLSTIVRAALDLPGDRASSCLASYYGETRPRRHGGLPWRFLRDLVGEGRMTRFEWRVQPFESAVEDRWPADRSTAVGRLVDRLRPFYAWTDKLAVIHADAHRGAFVSAYLLAAASVAMALMPLLGAQGSHGAPFIVVELGMILAILAIVFRGRRRGWHQRSIDYRLGAELVRHLRLMAPLGGARPFPNVPAHLRTYGHPAATWVAWYVRAVERDLGLPTAAMDSAHLGATLAQLRGELREQVAYHQRNATRYEALERRVEATAVVLMALTLAACALHLMVDLAPRVAWPPRFPPGLTFLAAVLPAFGAALAGISNQGEFRRIGKRSGAMRDQLAALLARADDLQPLVSSTEPPAHLSRRIEAVASDSARLMVDEVCDWRVVFLDRPQELPA